MRNIEILPTKERQKKGYGIAGGKKRMYVIDPLDYLFKRGNITKEQFEAGKRFQYLYIIAEEKGVKPAQVNWDNFISGSGLETKICNDDYLAKIQDQKKEYYALLKTIKVKGRWGANGAQTLKMICGAGFTLKEIEEKLHLVEGMSGVVVRDSLDDLIKVFGE